jgi:hypothetical protein
MAGYTPVPWDGPLPPPFQLPAEPTGPVHLLHLHQRCGSCRFWGTQYELGTGYCELPSEQDSPMRGSDYGGVVTRIDFGCLWWHARPAE